MGYLCTLALYLHFSHTDTHGESGKDNNKQDYNLTLPVFITPLVSLFPGTCQVLKKLDLSSSSSTSASVTSFGLSGGNVTKDQVFPQAGISAQASLLSDGRKTARKQNITLPPSLAK